MRRLLLAATAAWLATSCGYSLQGRGITTDPSVKTIGVPLFKDRSGKSGLDTRVTAAVIEELLKRGRFKVVSDATNVDAVVEGEILSYRTMPVGYSNSERDNVELSLASRFGTTIVAKVVYRKIGQAEPLWEDESFSQKDEFDVTQSPQVYFDREQQSMERLAQLFAKGLVSAMLEAF